MKATIFLCLKTVFAIIGTVIGAGFISGREIITFFHGNNFIFSIIVAFILFTLAFYFLLSSRNLKELKINSIFQPIILFGNLIILSGMISAIDELIFRALKISQNVPILSIFALVISSYIMKNGVDGLKIANTVLVPVILILTVVILLMTSSQNIVIYPNINVKNMILYVGVNTFMSSTVFNDLGEGLSKKQCAITAIATSFILCVLIAIIYLSIVNHNELSIGDAVPILAVFACNKKLLTVFLIIMFLGVITTLFSSHYPLYLFCENFQHEKIAKVLTLVIAFAISRLGFYNIVNYLYPLLGCLGAIYLVVTSILSKFFQARQQQST